MNDRLTRRRHLAPILLFAPLYCYGAIDHRLPHMHASRVMLPTPINEGEAVERLFPNLTAKQEAFVAAYVANGGKGTKAAEEAGYAPASAHVEANRLLKNDAIVQAVTQTVVRQLGTALPAALAKVMKLSSSAKSERVQLEASQDILNRAGILAPKQVRVGGSLNVTFDLS